MTTPVCRFVVSACLAGEFCRYDGGSNACAAVQELVRRGEAVTARRHGCTAAILKRRSPSCGVGQIYDGTFSRTLCPGDGLWARMLREAGFALYTEEHLPEDI